MKIFRRFKFGMLRLINWFVGDTNVMKYVSLKLKVPLSTNEMFFFIPEFKRAAKIRKIAVYRYLF